MKKPVGKNPGIVKEKGQYFASMQFERRANFDTRPRSFQNVVSRVEKASYLRNHSPLSCWALQLKEVRREGEIDTDYIENVASQCSKGLWELNQCRLQHDGPFEIPGTRGQGQSVNWKPERAIRITGSTYKRFLGLTSHEAKKKFLRQHVRGLDRYVS